MENEKMTVSVPPLEVEAVEVLPTAEEAVEAGLSKEETALAEKHGLVAPADKEPEEIEEEVQKPAAKKDSAAPLPTEEEAIEDPEKEKTLLDHWSKTGEKGRKSKGIYDDRKRATLRAQRAEAERDKARIDAAVAKREADDLKRKLEDAAKKPAPAPKVAPKEETLDDLLDPDGTKKPEETDPNKVPLTREDLDKIEKEKADKVAAEQAAKSEKLREISQAMDVHVADAKTRYTDFDLVQTYAAEIIKDPRIVSKDPRVVGRIITQVRELMGMISQAPSFKDGEYNPTDLAYEIGKLHPSYGKTNGSGKSADKGGGLTADQLKKIEENAGRSSSAAIPDHSAGGEVSVESLTPEQAARLSDKEFFRLPKTTRDRLLREAEKT